MLKMYEKTKKFLKKLGITHMVESNKKLHILDIKQEHWGKINEFCEKNNEIFTIERKIDPDIDQKTGDIISFSPQQKSFYITKKEKKFLECF